MALYDDENEYKKYKKIKPKIKQEKDEFENPNKKYLIAFGLLFSLFAVGYYYQKNNEKNPNAELEYATKYKDPELYNGQTIYNIDIKSAVLDKNVKFDIDMPNKTLIIIKDPSEKIIAKMYSNEIGVKSIMLPSGSYKIEVAQGKEWVNEKFLFGKDTKIFYGKNIYKLSTDEEYLKLKTVVLSKFIEKEIVKN